MDDLSCRNPRSPTTVAMIGGSVKAVMSCVWSARASQLKMAERRTAIFLRADLLFWHRPLAARVWQDGQVREIERGGRPLSLVMRTIDSFPRGRTTEELFALLDVDFSDHKRASILSELSGLLASGQIRKERDGRWRPAVRSIERPPHDVSAGTGASAAKTDRELVAVGGHFRATPILSGAEVGPAAATQLDPAALLRYYRAALRSDARGAITQAGDRHGTSWQLLTGSGPIVPGEEDAVQKIRIPLEALPDDFRKGLLRRDANEQTLALGWPIAVGRKAGAPAIWPVGLLSADWNRDEGHLEISVEADGLVINPDWIKGAARKSGWTEQALRDVFRADGAVGLPVEEFMLRLREAAAGDFRGKVMGRQMIGRIDEAAPGIYDIAGIFLPTDSTFTAGAVRDLDAIGAWPTDRLRRTALAPVLGLEASLEEGAIAALNTGPLNSEQISAVRNACASALSVVTGPPGTGKSQAIVSMAASILAAGGSVLVASKNHQALDAVEDRLGTLAPETPFLVRTLNPATEIDVSFRDVLASLASEPLRRVSPPDPQLRSRLGTLSAFREKAVSLSARLADLHCEIAALVERIEAREKYAADVSGGEAVQEVVRRQQWWRQLLPAFWRNLRSRKPAALATSVDLVTAEGAPTGLLRARLVELRDERAKLPQFEDPVALTAEIAELVKRVLPALLGQRAAPSEEDRLRLSEARDTLALTQENGPLPAHLAQEVVAHRPLWLASVLGTPKRVPLDDGLFDLVIFDEASQCDIASALPLLARAKRAVVVGDDRQLSFIPQVGLAQDRNLMQVQGLPIAAMGRFAQSRLSLFDFAIRVPGVPRVLLRDQYRSAGPIVDYISGQFYGGKLRVAFDPETMKPTRDGKPGIAWTHVAAPLSPTLRNVNPAETAAIVAHLEEVLVQQDYPGSIGVISPFRPQVAALSTAICEALPPGLLDRADLRVGTVDSFQGQERDLILFSPCLGPASAMSAVGFIQKDWRRLNVAISRARAIAHVFGDLNYARSGRIRSLERLAAYATEPRQRPRDGIFDSDWERRVFHALKARGLEPIPQFEIAGRRLDFAIFGRDEIKLDLEVDGRQFQADIDGNRKLADHWRDHQMKSLGWRVRRFWVDELATDLEGCLDLVEHDLS